MERQKAVLLAIAVLSIVAVIFISLVGRAGEMYQEDFVYEDYDEGEIGEAAEEAGGISFPPIRESFGLEKPVYQQVFDTAKQSDTTTEQKLIKTSYITLEVEAFYDASTSIKGIVSHYNGYVADTSEKDDDGRKYGYIIVRVPQQYFEDVIEEIKALGKVEEAKTAVKDVTEEYVDLQARLNNLKKQEERYLEILEVATTVEDILEVEIQLERIRGEIESYEGRLRYFDDVIDYATIQVNLREPREEKFEIGLIDALKDAVQGFFTALRAVIIFLGYFIPIFIIFGILAYIGRAGYKRFFEEK